MCAESHIVEGDCRTVAKRDIKIEEDIRLKEDTGSDNDDE
jgi:hypothetical protein